MKTKIITLTCLVWLSAGTQTRDHTPSAVEVIPVNLENIPPHLTAEEVYAVYEQEAPHAKKKLHKKRKKGGKRHERNHY